MAIAQFNKLILTAKSSSSYHIFTSFILKNQLEILARFPGYLGSSFEQMGISASLYLQKQKPHLASIFEKQVEVIPWNHYFTLMAVIFIGFLRHYFYAILTICAGT